MKDYVDKTAYDVVKLLRENNMRVSFAESCTGGLITAAIVAVPGASEVLDLSVVTYANGAKLRYTDVTEAMLAEHGAASKEVAIAMASGIRREAGANVGVGVTGIAGPDGGSLQKPVGTVYIAVSSEKTSKVKHFVISKDGREAVRAESARQALVFLRDFLCEGD